MEVRARGHASERDLLGRRVVSSQRCISGGSSFGTLGGIAVGRGAPERMWRRRWCLERSKRKSRSLGFFVACTPPMRRCWPRSFLHPAGGRQTVTPRLNRWVVILSPVTYFWSHVCSGSDRCFTGLYSMANCATDHLPMGACFIGGIYSKGLLEQGPSSSQVTRL